MTHGLNQEQLSHLKSLDSKKKKRKFLLDCMLENIDLEISNFFSKDYIKNESQEIIDKSNEPQPPMNFCVEIDSHNRGVLETAYTGFSTGKPVHFRAKYLHSNSLNTYMSTSDLIQESLLVTTNEFLTYIGRKDLIERKPIDEFLNSPNSKITAYGSFNPNGDLAINIENPFPATSKILKDQEILMQKMEESKGQILKLKEANLSPNQIESVLEYLSGFEQLKGSVIPIRFKEDAVSEKSELDKQIEYINQSKLPKWKFEEEYIDVENHLCWIYNRLIGYGENPNFDYMIKLKEIALNYSEPKQEVEEKVDLSKELYLTFDDGLDVFSIKVIDFEKKRGFGFDVDGCWNDSECTFWNWSSQLEYWRKSTPEEIKSMLIKKLEADGLKVGCKAIREWAKDEKIVPIKRIEYYYDSYHDTLECGGRTVYEKGKFATIIPWIEIQKEEEYLPYCVKVVDSNVEELTKLYNSIKMMEVKEIPTGMWLVCDTDNLEVINTPYKIVNTSDFMSYFQRYSSHAKLNKTENNELVNSSDEIKDIIVVDFENVSQKENPQ